MSRIKDFIMDVEEMVREGKTVAEISDATGFPPFYVETTIKNLEELNAEEDNAEEKDEE